MKWRMLCLWLATLATVPAYVIADTHRWLPPAVRDRPWPFALTAFAIALFSLAVSRRGALLAFLLAMVAAGALQYAAWIRYRLPESAIEGIGTHLPNLTLHDQAGNALPLATLTGPPTLLIWFRGSWCPYCRAQLADLALELRHYAATDLRIVAVAADPPEPLAKLERDLGLPFTLLSDPNTQLVNRCALAHCAAVLDGSGQILWGVVSGNWEKELPAHALVQAAYRAR